MKSYLQVLSAFVFSLILSTSLSAQVNIQSICACDDGSGNTQFVVTFGNWPSTPGPYDIGLFYTQDPSGTGIISVNGIPANGTGEATVSFPSVSDAATPSGTLNIFNIFDQTNNNSIPIDVSPVAYTINDPVAITCPDDQTEASCQNQTAINNAFDTWIADVSSTGGCDVELSNDWDGTYPDACGEVLTVEFTAQDNGCGTSAVCSATFTVVDAPAVTSSEPNDANVASCDFADQAAVDTDFAAWVATQTSAINVGGGCDPQISNDAPGSGPTHCDGGSIEVTWTITDVCLSPDITYTATYTLDAAPAVSSSAPSDANVASCDFADQAAVDADFSSWVSAQTTAINVGGGCDPQISNDAPTTGPTHCDGGSVVVTWTITDLCLSPDITYTASYTLDAAPAVSSSAPSGANVASCDFADQAAVDADFSAWVSAQTTAINVGGGCDPQISNDAPGAGPTHCDGGSVVVTWTITDLCLSPDIMYTASYTLDAAPAVTSSEPSDANVSSCDFADQAAVDADFSAWVSAQTTAINVGGGCDPQISNDAPGAGPTYCDGGDITVTWTITDVCLDPDITYTATYTLDAAPAVTSSAPSDENVSSCDFADQAEVDADFNAWVSAQTTAINVGGGCNPQISNNAPGAGPTHCEGGDITVTWTITDVCLSPDITYTATYTLDAAPAISVSASLSDVTVSSCDFADQTAVDADFASWVSAQTSAINVSGGCDPQISNDAPGAGPTHCEGGDITVTWTITDVCSPDFTYTATYTLDAAPAVTSEAPSDATVSSCDFADQAAVDTDFASWVSNQTSAINVGGGCDPQISNDAPGAGPTHCDGGSIEVTWTITDLCLSPDITYTATYTLDAAPAVTSSAPSDANVSSCDFADQVEVDGDFASWVSAQTAAINVGGGCDPQISNNAPGSGPTHCEDGDITVTWTITDLCLSSDITYMATYTLDAAPAVTSSAPSDETVSSCDFADQSEVDTDFNTWVSDQTAAINAGGGCDPQISNDAPSAGPTYCDGGSIEVTWTITDLCLSPNITYTATYTLEAAPAVTFNEPSDENNSSCDFADQAEVDADFNTWVSDQTTAINVGGGCDPQISNNSGGVNIPEICVGGTATVTWTITDDCGVNETVSADYILVAPDPVNIATIEDDAADACEFDDQSELDADFVNWEVTQATTLLNGFGGTGCSPSFSVSGNIPPELCTSEDVTINYEIFDTDNPCFTPVNVQAVYSYTAPDAVTFNNPSNTTESSCDFAGQAEVDADFAAWVSDQTTAIAPAGGCDPQISNDAPTMGPAHCEGGDVTVIWTITDLCVSPDITVSATYTLEADPTLSITCPGDQTETSCQTQAAIDAAFDTWIASVSSSGGCDVSITNDWDGTYPEACGDAVTVEFTATDAICGDSEVCSATFTVESSDPVAITCPADQTETSCQDQADINNAFDTWLADVSATGGCNVSISNDWDGTYPDACGDAVTVEFTATDSDCGGTAACSATFTVTSPAPVAIACPGDQTETSCQDQADINNAFDTWIADVSATGGCNVSVSNDWDGTYPDACGDAVTVEFTATDADCGGTAVCSATFTVTSPAPVAITCPSDQTESSCQDQADIDAAFNTWLAGVSATGGCDVTISNDASGAPDACGGSVTVEFTATDTECGDTDVCTATFTVSSPDPVVISCPGEEAQVFMQYFSIGNFTNEPGWELVNTSTNDVAFCELAGSSKVTSPIPLSLSSGVSYELYGFDSFGDGWNGNQLEFTEAGSGSTLLITGGSTSFSNNSCNGTVSPSGFLLGSFIAPSGGGNPMSCQTQTDINDAFDAWIGSVSASGGCDVTITNNWDNTYPDACGDQVDVLFTATDSECGGVDTCTATFTVEEPDDVVITCPGDLTEPACQDQADIEDAFDLWIADVSATGGCNVSISNDWDGTYPDACGDAVTVEFTATDATCGDSESCSATFTVESATPEFTACDDLTTMPNMTQADVDNAFSSWIASIESSVSGGCSVTISNDAGAAPDACGGSVTVNFEAQESVCGGTATCAATFTVPENTTQAAIGGLSTLCIGSTIPLTSNPMGGTGPYTFNWSATPGTGGSFDDSTIENPELTADAAGPLTITVVVTDANGCTATDEATINIPMDCDFEFNIADPCVCNNDADVNADNGTFMELVTVTGPSGAVLPAGQNWTLQSVDGAYSASPFNEENTPGPQGAPLASGQVLSYCSIPGGCTVYLSPGGTQLQAPFGSYYLAFAHVDEEGYTMDVEGPNAPGDFDNTILNISNVCFYPQLSITSTTQACDTDGPLPLQGIPNAVATSGSVQFNGDATFMGGQPPYSYTTQVGLLDNGDGSATFDPSMAGYGEHIISYSFEGNPAPNSSSPGCWSAIEFTFEVDATLELTADVTEEGCAGTEEGAIDLTVTPSAAIDPADYVFSWSNGATTEDLTDLPGGNYSVTVTHPEACTQTASFFVASTPNPDPIVDISGNGQFTIEQCVDVGPIVISGNIIDCEISSTNPVVAGDISISGIPGLAVTWINNQQGFAYFEITGDVAEGSYLLLVQYDGVPVDHIVNVVQDPDSEAPEITVCPAALSDVAAPDVCELEVSLTAPIFDDNCPNSEVVVTYQVSNPDNSVSGPFDVSTDPDYTFDVGTSQVTWFVTDLAGNVSTCVQQVDISDNQTPEITCPTVLASYDADMGACSFTMPGTGFDPTVDDNCEIETLSHDYGAHGNPSSLAGASFPVGTTAVIWTVTDVNGNIATCSFDVAVVDNEDPTFDNCPIGPIVVGSDFSNCQGSVNWSQPIASDNCDVDTVVQISGPTPGDTLDVGTYTVVYEATDVNGNTALCSFDVEVIDTQDPIVGCPADITVNTDEDVCSWTNPSGSIDAIVAIENCPGELTWEVENPDGSTGTGSENVDSYDFELGTSTVTYTLVDETGTQSDECSFNVTVEDNEAPDVTCPVDVASSSSTGDCFLSLAPELSAADASDNCSVFGDLDIEYEIQGPDNGLFGPFGNGTSFDFVIGISQVTFTVVDESGNVSTCTYTVEITDDENPMITCAILNAAYDTDDRSCDYTVVGDEFDPVLISDNCLGATATHNYAFAPNSNTLEAAAFPVGTTTVVWTVEDASGNTSTCSIDVVVEDNELPEFVNCPTDTIQTGNEFSNCSAGVNWSIPIASDNCSAEVTQISGPTPGSVLDVGIYEVVYQAEDPSGNTVECTFAVEVSDVQQPIVGCPQDITVSTDAGVCEWASQAGSLTVSVAIENCEPSLTWEVENPDGSTAADSGDVSGYVFDLGESIVTYTLTDSSGVQVDECSFRVTVEDTEAPVITCPADEMLSASTGDCFLTLSPELSAADASDNCTVFGDLVIEYEVQGPDLSLNGPFANGSDFDFGIGISQVTFTVVDEAGNASTCTYTVEITDDEVPMIECATLDPVYDTDPGVCDYTVQGDEFDPVSVSDNCAVESVINDYNATSSLANEVFPLGSTDVVWTVTDESGNTATCLITVLVEDNENPVFVNCPADTITVGNDFSNCSGGVNWSVPIATDNCEVTVAQTAGPTPGDILDVGVYTVTYIATDGNNNTAECTFEIEVIDVQDPIIGCPEDLTISTDPGVCEWGSQAGSLSPIVAIENCEPSLTWEVENPDGSTAADSGDVSGYVFELGVSTVTYTLTDSSGTQIDVCSFNVTVEDTEAPVITCPANEVLSASAGDCFLALSPELSAADASDNCTVFGDLAIDYEVQGPDNSLSGPFANGTSFDFAVGISQVTFTVVDEAGNASTCTYTVEITDDEDPTIDCATLAAAYDTDPGTCSYVVQGDEFDPVVGDNCAVESVVNDYNATSSLANEVFPLGTTDVIWTVTDENGNTATCLITVVIEDNENPVFVNCPADTITVGNDFSNCSGGVNWSVPLATDNCEVSVAQTAGPTPGDILDVGVYTVTYIATDGNNNTAECTFEIEVIDVQDPIIGCPEDLTVSTDPGVCEWASQAGSLSPIVAIENCEPSLTWEVENPDGSTAADSGDVSGYVFLLGESIVTYTLSDSSGTQISECSFRVTVEDNEAPVIPNCSAGLLFGAGNFVLSADSGVCFVSIEGGFGATDNCELAQEATVVFTRPDGSLYEDTYVLNGSIYELPLNDYEVGQWNFTVMVSDESGNVSSCTGQFLVEDNENPTIECATIDSSYDTDAGVCDYTVQGDEFDPVVGDNCAVESVVNDYNATSSLANEVFNIGTTEVIWTVTDESGNTASCSITVVVEDNENPVFVNCPDTITVGNNFSNCSGDVNWSEPIAEDNCDEVAVTQIDGPAPGGFLPVGEYEVTYEAVDSAGNTAICTFIVEVTDTQAPIIGCPDDVTVDTDSGVCEWASQVGSLTPTVAIENCEPELVWSVTNPDGSTAADSGDVSGYVFLLGESIVTYTLSDSTGTQVAECSFRVTVEDTEAPVISCPADEVLSVSTGNCFLTLAPELLAADASDNCTDFGDLVIEYEVQGPDNSLSGPFANGSDFDFPVGINQVTFTVVDEAGNASTCTYTIEIIDDEAPTIICAVLDSFYNTDAGSCDYTVQGDEFDPVVDDSCGVESVINDYNATSSLANEVFPVGSTDVVWTVTDESGNTATCSITVVVEDNEVPSFVNCPDTITVGNNFSNCSGNVSWAQPVGTDNCGQIAVNQISGPSPGGFLPVGEYEVSYEVIDNSGNVDTCEFIVEVVDTQAPIIGCPDDLTINTDVDVCEWASQTGSLTPTVAIENCAPELVWSVENPDGSITADSGDVSGYVFLLGESTVTYTLSDSTGSQVAECSFRVTVEDNQAPDIVCQPDIEALTDPGVCQATLELIPPSFSDNCDADADSVYYIVVNPDQSVTGPLDGGTVYSFQLGISIVEWTLTDESGNASSCIQNVEVVDEEAPELICPAEGTGVTYTTSEDGQLGNCGVVGELIIPHGTDNCELVQLSYSITLPDGSVDGFFDLSYVYANPQLFGDSTVLNYYFPVGESIISVIVEDASGNQAVCNYAVEVIDDEAPEFINCPSDTIQVSSNFTDCTGDGMWNIPFATDNCEAVVEQIAGPTPGQILPVGVYDITYVATDSAGNSTECSFVVEVVDTEDPIIVCPGNLIVSTTDQGTCDWTAPEGVLTPLLSLANCDYTVTYEIETPNAGGVMNADLAIWNFDDPAKQVSPNVPYTADGGIPANEDVAEANVVGADFTAWNAGASGQSINANGWDNGNGSKYWIVTLSTTGYENLSLSSAQRSSNTGPQDFAVEYSVNGGSTWTSVPGSDVTLGNNFTEGVLNNLALPSAVNDQADVQLRWIMTSNTSVNGSAVADGGTSRLDDVVISGDLIGNTITGFDDASGETFPLGTSTVTYTITEDVSGQTWTCSFDVTVVDEENPEVFCPADQVVMDTDDGVADCEYVVDGDEFDATAMDNCGVEFLTHDYDAAPSETTLGGASFPVGTTIVTWTAVDTSGNSSSCSFAITVIEEVMPMISCPTDTVITVSDGVNGTCDGQYEWDHPVPTDNCEVTIYTVRYVNPDGTIDGPFNLLTPAGIPANRLFDFGITTVTYYVSDASGNTIECSFTVEVLDDEAPLFTNCDRPAVVENAETGECSAFVNFSLPLAEDNCPAGLEVIQVDDSGLTSGDVFPVGLTILKWVAIDAAGNVSDTCELKVIVNDTQAPTLECLSDTLGIANDPGECGAIVEGIEPTLVEDNCIDNTIVTYKIEFPSGGDSILSSGFGDASGTFFDVGRSLVTYCVDDQPLLRITEVTQSAAGGVSGANVNIPGYFTGDEDSDYIEVTNFGPQSLDVSCLGVEKLPGSAAGSGSIIIPEGVVLAPGEVLVVHTGAGADDVSNRYFNLDAGNAESGAAAGYALSFEGEVIDVVALNGFDPVNLGNLAVVQAGDWSGATGNTFNTAGVKRAYVFDSNDGSDFEVLSDDLPGSIGAYNSFYPDAIDNGGLTSLQNVRSNRVCCSFEVEVLDVENPMIVCPDDAVVPTSSNGTGDCTGSHSWTHPVPTDNCEIDSFSITYLNPDGSVEGPETIVPGEMITRDFDLGQTIVQYYVEDIYGNSTGCGFSVDVFDDEAPIISCPNDLTINLDPGECRIAVSYIEDFIDENCAIDTVISTPPSGSFFEIGVTDVTFIVIDEAGLSDTCSFEITVNEFEVTNYTFACNDHINLSLDQNCEALINADMVLEGNNYGCYDQYEITVENSAGQQIGLLLTEANVGDTVFVTVIDTETGNSCTTSIFVEDKLPPVVECPADTTIFCSQEVVPNATGAPVLLSCDFGVDIDFVDTTLYYQECEDTVAQVVRTWTITDQSGNEAECVQNIYILGFDFDQVQFPSQYDGFEQPALSCVDVAADPELTEPVNTGFPTLEGVDIFGNHHCELFVGYEDRILTQANCASGYEIYRSWIIRDACLPVEPGVNPIEFVQLIRVEDKFGPEIDCVDELIVSTGSNECAGEILLPVPTITDGCADESDIDYTVETVSGNLQNLGDDNWLLSDLQIGTHFVTYRATDGCKNTSFCVTRIVVEDQTPPIAVCDQTTKVALDVNGEARVHWSTIDDGSYDNCGIDRIEVRRMDQELDCEPGAFVFKEFVDFCCADIERSPVQVLFRVTDVAGNQNTCMVSVNVEDKLPPALVGPADLTISCTYPFDEWNLDEFGRVANLTEGETRETREIYDEDYERNCLGNNQYDPTVPTYEIVDGFAEDNCSLEVTSDYSDEREDCGTGVIVRTFRAVDDFGNSSTAFQRITVEQCTPFTENDIDWPNDRELACDDNGEYSTDPDATGEPEISNNNACTQIAVRFDDEMFEVTPDACFKILRTWTVLDWCQEDANGDNLSWTYTQTIKVNDDETPELLVCDDVTFCDSAAVGCEGFASLVQEVEDCTPEEFLNITWRVKPFNAGNNPNDDIVGSGLDASGMYPFGTHRITWIVEDMCGNVGTCQYLFTVEDCKLPTPVVINGLATVVMPSSGCIDIEASLFDAGSFDNCGEVVMSYSSDTTDNVRTFCCDDTIGVKEVAFWVTDESGNQDFVLTYIDIQDPNGVCPPIDSNSIVINGQTATHDALGVEDVEVYLEDMAAPTPITRMTDGEGFYQMYVSAGADYRLTPYKNDDVLNGVNTMDILLIQQHILGLNPISNPYELIAANVNDDARITGADIIHVRRAILGIDSEFTNNTSWRFVAANDQYEDGELPLDYVESIEMYNAVSNQIDKDFVAVKIGDVNGTAIPSSLDSREAEGRSGALILTALDAAIESGEVVEIDVTSAGFSDVLGYQLTLDYGSDAFELIDVRSGALDLTEGNYGVFAEAGVLTMSWNETESVSYSSDEVLFTLVLKAQRADRLSDALEINDAITPTEAYVGGETRDIVLRFTTDATEFALYQNVPNPFESKTVIGFNLPQAGEASLTFYDAAGQVVHTIENEYKKGYNEETVDSRDIPANGLYYYELRSGDFQATKKMVVSGR